MGNEAYCAKLAINAQIRRITIPRETDSSRSSRLTPLSDDIYWVKEAHLIVRRRARNAFSTDVGFNQCAVFAKEMGDCRSYAFHKWVQLNYSHPNLSAISASNFYHSANCQTYSYFNALPCTVRPPISLVWPFAADPTHRRGSSFHRI